MPRLMVSCLTVIVLLLLLPEKASAYVDPGSGALLWQTVVASVVGLMFYFRRVFIRLLRGSKRDR